MVAVRCRPVFNGMQGKQSNSASLFSFSEQTVVWVKINQLHGTEVFIADLIACATCFGHHYALHQELKSIIQWLLPVVFRAVVFQVAGLLQLQHPANRTHNPQLRTRPAT